MIAIVGFTCTHSEYMDGVTYFSFFLFLVSLFYFSPLEAYFDIKTWNWIEFSVQEEEFFHFILFIAPRWMTLTMTWLMIVVVVMVMVWLCNEMTQFQKSFNRRQLKIVHSNTLSLSRPVLFHSPNSSSFFIIFCQIQLQFVFNYLLLVHHHSLNKKINCTKQWWMLRMLEKKL